SSRFMPPAGVRERSGDTAPTKRPSAAGDQSMTVEDRLSRVEKSLRKWKFTNLALAIAVAALAGGVGYDYLGVRSTLRARRVLVVNERGSAIELDSTTEGDGIVSVHDSLNVPRAILGNSRKGYGTLELYGGAQQKLISVGGSGSGGQIAVYNCSGHKV